jgi:hypothetical protein
MTDTDLDEIGYDEVRHRLNRGDYCDPEELKVVMKWLQGKVRERDFLADCERANLSSALVANNAARRATLIAFLALIISVLSARDQILAFVSELIELLSK